MTDAKELVQAFRQSLSVGDFAAARGYLDDKLSFEGPIENFHSPEPYLESLKKLSHIIDRIEPLKIFVDGSDVYVLYDMVTTTSAGTAFIAEWYHTARGKIGPIHVIFDRGRSRRCLKNKKSPGNWSASCLKRADVSLNVSAAKSRP